MLKLAILLVISPGAFLACSSPASNQRYRPAALPSENEFPPVAELLDVRCGSLDCHGNAARNLRLFGSAGLRWSPLDRPLIPPCDTADEIAQDYQSVVGLEPEVISAVVRAGGADPERLTLVRKARGTEAHKGGTIWSQGGDADKCLTSWLSGSTDTAACSKGLSDVLPIGPLNPLLGCVGH